MKKVAIGVDIGGTNVKIGIVDAGGRVLVRQTFPTEAAKGRRALFHNLTHHLRELIHGKSRKKSWKILGIGVGAPGPIDPKRGVVYVFPNIPGWKNAPLKQMLERSLRLPAFVDNDANVMALAEYRFGAGRGTATMIALTLGTGVGGGLVIGGKLFTGSHYSAAEIGHLIINEEGPRCGCGNRGCLEAYVGNGYFTREVQRHLDQGEKSILKRWIREGEVLTPSLVSRAAKRGDLLAKRVWEKTGGHLGTALAGLVNILNPDRIVIGGGIAGAGDILFNPIRSTLAKKAFPIASRSVKVVRAKLSNDAGLVGGASLVFQHFDE